MNRDPFLADPLPWTRTARQLRDPVGYACAVERHPCRPRSSAVVRGAVLAVVIGAAIAAVLVYGGRL